MSERRAEPMGIWHGEPAASFTVNLTNSNETFRCASGQSVLSAMEQLGHEGIRVGCRGGGCGVCKIFVESGRVRGQAMSRACLSTFEEAQGFVLACRAHPESDLKVTAVDHLARRVQPRSGPNGRAQFLARALSTRTQAGGNS